MRKRRIFYNRNSWYNLRRGKAVKVRNMAGVTSSLIKGVLFLLTLAVIFLYAALVTASYPQPYPYQYPQQQAYPQTQMPGYSVQSMGGYGQQSYTIGANGIPQSTALMAPQEPSFKEIINTFPTDVAGWSPSQTTTLNVNGKNVGVLGLFAGTGGQGSIFKNFSLAGIKDFSIDVDFYFVKSWDGEKFTIFFNNKPIGQYSYNWQAPFQGKNCKVLIDKIPLDAPQWPSRKIECTFKGSFENNKMTIDGQDVTDLNGPTNLKIGFGSTLDQGIDDEAFSIEQVKITPAKEDPRVPRKINITVLSPYPVPVDPNAPMPTFSYPFQPQPGGSPAAVATSVGGPQAYTPPLSQMMEPQYYLPSTPPATDRTAGSVTDRMTREGASKCARCQAPNRSPQDTDFCLKECVTLDRQAVENMDRENDTIRSENTYLKQQLQKFQQRNEKPQERQAGTARTR